MSILRSSFVAVTVALSAVAAQAATVIPVTQDGTWNAFTVDANSAKSGGVEWIDVDYDLGGGAGDFQPLSFSFTVADKAILRVVDLFAAGDVFNVSITSAAGTQLLSTSAVVARDLNDAVLPDAANAPVLLLPPSAKGRDLKLRALRPSADGPRKMAVQASDEQGRVVARIELAFGATETKGEGLLPAPPELRNRMARLDLEGQGGAGGAVLLDERNRRRPVSVLGEKPTANGQPLLQEIYFLEKALDPYVSLAIGDRETVLNRGTAVLLIPDSAAPSANDREEIAKWIEGGGVAVRFAGPNLAAGGDSLVPTPLRVGDRALGGIMSWGQPSALAEFPTNSPFLGIAIPKDVRISQQVLAEPTPNLADKTWARLADGTPLVTAEKRGAGHLVLIHTTANTNWSNLALSGLFVNMLQRLVILSRGVAGDGVNKSLKPWRTLDGFGKLGAPPAGAQMLPADADHTFKPTPATPPGQSPRQAPTTGTPGVFVPIVPVGGATQAPRPGTVAPGSVTPVPPPTTR